MKNTNYVALFVIPAAAIAFAARCAAAPATSFTPSQTSSGLHLEPKAGPSEVQILQNPPSENAVIIGEVQVQGGPESSLHDMMAAALDEAAKRGADFIALTTQGQQSGRVSGKMVPIGHGRSLFVADPVQGGQAAGICVILGKYTRKVA